MSIETPLDIARRISGLPLARMQRMSGTGISATIRVTGILKVSPDASETELLRRFMGWLSDDYAVVFPRFRDLGIVDGSFVTELEYLGDATFENVLLGDAPNVGLSSLEIANRVSGFIERLSAVRPPVESKLDHRRMFLAELVSGLTHNAEIARLHVPALTPDACLARMTFVPCGCHRDLSVGNVVCAVDGGVRLIDPRSLLPGAVEPSTGYGSAAADCAAFLVGLERKQAELLHRGNEQPRVPHNDFLVGTTERLIANGLFDRPMFDLCHLHAYSVYLACRCDYCLAPERKWLYDLMRKGFDEVSARIA